MASEEPKAKKLKLSEEKQAKEEEKEEKEEEKTEESATEKIPAELRWPTLKKGLANRRQTLLRLVWVWSVKLSLR